MPPKDPLQRQVYNAKYYRDNKTRIIDNQRIYFDKNPHIKEDRHLKAKTRRDKNREQEKVKKKIYRAQNRAAISLKNKRYRETHPDYDRQRYAKNPEPFLQKGKRRRALRNGAMLADLTVAQWQEIKNAYDHRCVYCGRKMRRLTQDHIIPLSKGGAHTASNIVPACQSCNSKKKDGPVLKPVQPLLLTIAPPKKGIA